MNNLPEVLNIIPFVSPHHHHHHHHTPAGNVKQRFTLEKNAKTKTFEREEREFIIDNDVLFCLAYLDDVSDVEEEDELTRIRESERRLSETDNFYFPRCPAVGVHDNTIDQYFSDSELLDLLSDDSATFKDNRARTRCERKSKKKKRTRYGSYKKVTTRANGYFPY